MITPKPIIEESDGAQRPVVLGMPYGSLPRLILIHVMTAALRDRSRHVLLGATFADWMRRMGFRTISYGPRGSATLIRQQLDRLLACEWMIRWDSANGSAGEREFGIKEIKLTNEWVGVDRRNSFSREIYLTEAFYNHLQHHAVPLDECAIRQLRDSATALDLYTWLAYRLPRISSARPVTLSWQQLASHFGNDRADIRKFRYSLRDAWERQVSAVYPAARAEFDTKVVRLYPSPAPLERKLLSIANIQLAATNDAGSSESTAGGFKAPERDTSQRFLEAMAKRLGANDAQSWLTGARLERIDDRWVLTTRTTLNADWIRSRFRQALEAAAEASGLEEAPEVRARLP
jgi:hypothetical protein